MLFRSLDNTIRVLCCLANGTVRKGSSVVFSLVLQSLDAASKCNSSGAAKTVVLQRLCVAEETAAALTAGWTLEMVDIGRNCDELCLTVQRLNINMASICKQVSSQPALQSYLCDARYASSLFEGP